MMHTSATSSRINLVTNNNIRSINNNNNNNNINTEPGVLFDGNGSRLDSDTLDQIVTAYQDAIGQPLNSFTAKMIKDYLAILPYWEIIDAIEVTAFAPRPSPAYLRAVLRNKANSGDWYHRSRQDPHF